MRIILFSLFFLCSHSVNASKIINWYVYDRPPSHFLSGPKAGQGYLDRLLAITIKDLNEYRHITVKATIARGLREMKQGKNACHLSIFKTPQRELFTQFSIAHIMSPNLRVIISKKLVNELNLPKTVSVDMLFSRYKLKAIKLPERSYTEHVDKIFSKYPEFLYNRPTLSESGLYKMLKSGRVDFLIAVPTSANYLLDDSASEFDSLAIEGIEKYGVAYIGCSNTAWGKKVIQKINTVLIDIKSTDAHFNAMSSWLPKEEVNQEYIMYYKKHFLKN